MFLKAGVMQLCTIFLQTPIGKIRILQSVAGVREIALDREYNSCEEIVKCQHDNLQQVNVVSYEGSWCESADETINWLRAFFSTAGQEKISKTLTLPPIDNEIFVKDNFTGKVLRTLAADVPFGSKVSYAGLATMCGSPKACRAVGQAMRANPVPLLVPCHRVIASDGKAGHYMSGKGDNIKKWLLDFEQKV